MHDFSPLGVTDSYLYIILTQIWVMAEKRGYVFSLIQRQAGNCHPCPLTNAILNQKQEKKVRKTMAEKKKWQHVSKVECC